MNTDLIVLNDCQFPTFGIISHLFTNYCSLLTIWLLYPNLCSINNIEHSLLMNMANYINNHIYIYSKVL